MNQNIKKVIVTGGCGYIGSHVARAFKQHGDSVFIIDRVKRDHTLKDCDGFFIDDFASNASIATIVDLEPDIIVHCAGTSLVGPSVSDPDDYYQNNIAKTIKLLSVVSSLKKKPAIMFSSSASVYGEPESLPIREDSKIQPISPYGATKAMSERIFADYGSAYGFDSVIFRYFNAAGAMPNTHDLGQEPGATHIVARVLEASLSNRVFNIYGDNYNTKDGTCVRDYVHVWDIAQAHVKARDLLAREDLFDRTANQWIFNLGTGSGISNLQIANYVRSKYGLAGVNFTVPRSGDPAELVADPEQANKTLGWTAKHSTLESIVDSAYQWYKNAV